MIEDLELTLPAVRAVLLAAQGLLTPPPATLQKADVLAAIRRMGALQIDSISVVARSPYLVLWSRLGHYDPRWLDELLAEGALFEYWAHAACFLPIEDYGLYRQQMLAGRPEMHAWVADHPTEVATVLDRITAQGGTRSAEFVRSDGRKSGPWWDWKPEKETLERLFYIGTLMVARREGFQRVYDLRERVLPGWDDAQVATAAEVRRALTLKTVRALGVAPARWVPDYFYLTKRDIGKFLETLADEGALVRVRVAGWKDVAYVHPDNLALVEQAAAGELQPSVTSLLSPFDPVIADRARLLELFGFAYRIEVYTPAPKRQYGYYTLPILHRGAIIGRLDPKAHRQQGLFEVRALHLEPGIAITDELVADLAATLRACAAWHQTPQVVVQRSDPPALAGLLTTALT
ncbi:MAG: winged helix DNA-binding domain-containing protein [Chloroflexota bacterium]|nr:winged helix DNA-binding domain-containing protein [Chloroflexota bacterium]